MKYSTCVKVASSLDLKFTNFDFFSSAEGDFPMHIAMLFHRKFEHSHKMFSLEPERYLHLLPSF